MATPSASSASLPASLSMPGSLPSYGGPVSAASMHTRTGSHGLRVGLANRISSLEYEGMTYLITDCPTEMNLAAYVDEFTKRNVKHLVRLCEVGYRTEPFTTVGIRIHDLPFKDGQPPPPNVIKSFLAVLDECLSTVDEGSSASSSSYGALNDHHHRPPAIAVHCVAGLGRAPVMVAIALIEQGMKPLDAIEFIRKHRRNAFNSRQIDFVVEYKRRPKQSSFRRSLSKMFKK